MDVVAHSAPSTHILNDDHSEAAANTCASPSAVKDADVPPAQELLRACQEALASALTKFDALDTYFAAGWAFDAVCDMLIEEVRQDSDFIPPPAASRRLDEVRLLVKRTVGKAFGDWKKARGLQKEAKRLTPQGEIPLPWASIDAYPDWVVNQIENYLQAGLDEKQSARRVLERTLLEKPLIAASIKYDGTCLGKMDNGDLVGRRLLLGRGSTTYQQTSTAKAAACDVPALRDRLAEIAGVELGRVCAWGELMCNPGFYSYRDRGLHEKWVCFGVVVALRCASASDRFAEELQKHGLAHSISSSREQVRLLLCPALRRLLLDVAGCDEVAQEQAEGHTHAEAVAQAAAGLRAGENEGLVLVFERPGGQASQRKWKNSSEGGSVSKRHARALRACLSECRSRASDGDLDPRVVDMVETMLGVAEAETAPAKKGRRAFTTQGR